MPTGKQNNLIKNKLNSLTEVPNDFHFSSFTAWQKLEAQLHKKRHLQTTKFFRTVAVCILLFILSCFFYFNLTNERNRKAEITQKGSELPKEVSLTQLPKGLQTSLTIKEANPVIKTKKEVFIKPKPTVIEPVITIIDVDSNVVLEKNISEKIPAVQSLSSVAIENKEPKRRFKIAHINELIQGGNSNDLSAKNEKNTYGFTLRKDLSLHSEDEKEQRVYPSVTKTKSIYNILNSH